MKLRIIILLIGLIFSELAFSQNSKKFSQKRKVLFEQLHFAEDLLSESEDISYNALVKLKIIKNKISYRKAIVETFNKEISIINKKIEVLKTEQSDLQHELTIIKKEYEQLIYYAYKNRSAYDKLMFILSAETFTQAYKRLKYLEQYTEYRKKQVDYIRFKNTEIEKSIIELEGKKIRKLRLIDNRLKEQESLEAEKKKEEKVVKNVENDFPALQNLLEISEKNNTILGFSVNKLITNMNDSTSEASILAKKARIENNKKISDNFISKKGKLQSPVEKGIIVSSFGNHNHPNFENLIIRNDGIDILTVSGSIVSSIFTGEVVKIIDIPGLNKSILIKHGNYYSLYSNIVNVNVSENELVEEGQEIGIIFTDKFEDNSSILKFQIWKEKEKLNPEKWVGNF